MFFCGMVHLMPSIWFREFHMQHHRHTQDTEKDPELGTEHPRTIGSYIFLITGIKIWIDLVNNFFRLFSGNANESYINKHNSKKVETRGRLIVYSWKIENIDQPVPFFKFKPQPLQ